MDTMTKGMLPDKAIGAMVSSFGAKLLSRRQLTVAGHDAIEVVRENETSTNISLYLARGDQGYEVAFSSREPQFVQREEPDIPQAFQSIQLRP